MARACLGRGRASAVGLLTAHCVSGNGKEQQERCLQPMEPAGQRGQGLLPDWAGHNREGI